MAINVADRVKETSTTTGTGTLTLLGAVANFRTFSSAVGNTNECFYTIVNDVNSEWEVGRGTVGAGTLSRDTVIASSNAGSLVSLTAGTHTVFTTIPGGGDFDFGDATKRVAWSRSADQFAIEGLAAGVGAGNFRVAGSFDGNLRQRIHNTSAGNSALAQLQVNADSASVAFEATSSTNTGTFGVDAISIQANASAARFVLSTGGSAPIEFFTNGVSRMVIGAAGEHGFFGATAVAQPTDIVALTDNSGGTANSVIAAITNAANAGSADVGPTADAIADLAAKFNGIRTRLRNLGLMA